MNKCFCHFNGYEVKDAKARQRLDNLKIVNVKDFGALGDGVKDDTLAIQNAIDYAYDNNIFSIYLPGGEYTISKPLLLYGKCKIYGDNAESTKIHKTSNEKCDIENHKYDAIIILTDRDYSIDGYTEGQQISNLSLIGNIETYTSDKSENEKQYAILCIKTNGSPKVKITDFIINNVDVGIKSNKMWMSSIKNSRWLSCYYRAIYIVTESQGLNIENINTSSTHEVGIELNGATYSTLTNILIEWLYGGIAYKLSSWRGDILNCGYEQGNGVKNGFALSKCNVRLTGGFLSGKTPENETDCFIFNVNNSTLEIENTSIGHDIQNQEYNGSIARVTNNSHLMFGKGNTFYCKFKGNILCESDSNSASLLTIDGITHGLLNGKTSYFREIQQNNIDYLDESINNTPKILEKNIYLDNISNPYKSSTKTDLSWGIPYKKGDIGFYNNPKVTGQAGFICNRNNKTDVQEIAGTIQSISNGSLTFDTTQITDYADNGITLYKNCSIEGVTSGASAVVDSYTDKIVYISSLSGAFVEGEKVRLKSTTNARNGDFVMIPIISSGKTFQRPTTSLTVGQMYYDTNLNKPIWYKGSSKWVDATGTEV